MKSAARPSNSRPCRSMACLPPGDLHELDLRRARDVAADLTGPLEAGDPVLASMHDQDLATTQICAVSGVDPRIEGHDGHDAGRRPRQKRRPPAEGVSDQSEGHVADLLLHLAHRPDRVRDRGVLGVPAAPGVQQPVDGQPVTSGACDGARRGDHPDHRQLCRAHHHPLASRGTSVQDDDGSGDSPRTSDLDQSTRGLHPEAARYFSSHGGGVAPFSSSTWPRSGRSAPASFPCTRFSAASPFHRRPREARGRSWNDGTATGRLSCGRPPGTHRPPFRWSGEQLAQPEGVAHGVPVAVVVEVGVDVAALSRHSRIRSAHQRRSSSE